MTSITLYDVQSTMEEKAISPASVKLRLFLDYKKIHYDTVWIDFPDIESTAKAVGALPTKLKVDGSPAYTIPFVTIASKDGATIAISDSVKIVEYIEKTYPDPAHKLLPTETRVFQAVFSAYLQNKMQSSMAKLALMPVVKALPPHTQKWYLDTRANFYGKEFIESIPKDQAGIEKAWKGFEEAFDDIAAQLDIVGEGNFRITGDVSLSEFELVALLYLIKRILYQEGWKERLEVRNGGRWAKLLNLPVYRELLPVN